MAGRKYASDYRVEPYRSPDGKVRERRVYQGVYYAFRQPQAVIRRLGRTVLVLSTLAALLLLPLLFLNGPLARTLYVVLPAVAAYVPLYLLMAAALRLERSEAPFTRENRDKTDQRLRGAAVFLSVFLTIACIGCIVYYLRSGWAEGEVLCAMCLVAAWGMSMYLLTQRKLAEAVPLETAEPQEPDETSEP